MSNAPSTIPYRTMGEWELHSDHPYLNPFIDVQVNGTFISPSGKTYTMPAFYDGNTTWRLRFNPGEIGQWRYITSAQPVNKDLVQEGSFKVIPHDSHGFLLCTPGRAWGFHFESGEPVLIWGDTTYNLFAMAYCGGDVLSFMRRRVSQGFNLLRIRVPVSPFHPPKGYSSWQTRRTSPWLGSEQCPLFDQFNLDYFHCVDQVMRQLNEVGLGVEIIMEAWGFEFPFNSRHIFTSEWEELWMRYLIARYDAFPNLWFWTPLNEYEYYPNGDWNYKPVADRWAMRIARWIKATAPHGHIISVHNGPREPAFAVRFKADPGSVDSIMFQDWGTRDEENAWLAAGIEETIRRALDGWWGSAVFAEYGYERNPDLELLVPNHAYCDTEHNRRAAWRGLFCGLGVIHGFENSWGPWMILDQDLPGIVDIQHELRFFTEIVPFHRLRPADNIIAEGETAFGHRPLALATPERDIVAIYMPVGGHLGLNLPDGVPYQAQWYDPRKGTLHHANLAAGQGIWIGEAPPAHDARGRPLDWVLVLKKVEL